MGDCEVTLRPANKEDMVAVAALRQELADFHNFPDGPKINASVLQQDGFDSTPPAFKCLVAESKGRLVGYAVYYPAYSTFVGRTMMLQDLCVTASMRRSGVGQKLFNAVAKEALSSGCSRLDFHVMDWNDSAKAFYERHGCINLSNSLQYCVYRLAGDALQNASR